MSTRSELTKQYKAAFPPMGVYVVRNLVTGRVFLGSSMNVHAAMNRHQFELRLNHHRNPVLQDEWRRHGADNLRFEVLDLVKQRDDPAFDYRAELSTSLALWREELGCRGDTMLNLT